MSHYRYALLLALAATALSPATVSPFVTQAVAQQAAAQPSAGSTLAWPRSFDVAGQVLQVYQPLIETWNGDQITGRTAVALGPKDGTPVYGTARFTAHVAIDKPARLAYLGPVSIDSVDVPTDPTQDSVLKSALQSRIPTQAWAVALDHLQTSYAAGKDLTAELNVPVKNDVPHIVFKSTPTDLVLISGTPVLKPIEGASTYQRVMNSRALILQGPDNIYHLNAAGFWYQSSSLDGSWVETTTVDRGLLDAAKVAGTADAPDAMLPEDGKPPAQPPELLVTTAPTELILTTGEPQMAPVAGTASLLRMTNADHAVFLDPNSNLYYVLISGRWFSGKGGPTDPWAYVPGTSLPSDFPKISPQDPGGTALVSIPGTPQAKEATIAATIPQTATVRRSTTLDVKYDGGAAKFVPIAGTSLLYAENTATPVIQLDGGRFYAVSAGVWFVAPTPVGPWIVADVVPDVIYTIPVSSPVHYVTYVRVYSATSEDVVVGYTPGYFGVAINDGLVVYGTGYACVGYVGTVWYGCPVTYGYGANFALDTAAGFAFGFAAGAIWGSEAPYWGPYWGAGPWGGSWNHVNINQTNIYGRWGGEATVTHGWGYNSMTGTEWSGRSYSGHTAGGTDFAGRSAAAFNPYTGNGAAGRQSASYNANTGIGHASESGITDNNGNINAASRGIAGNAKTGNGVAWNNGNVYTDHDGNIHQYNDNGGWQTHDPNGSGWHDEQDPATLNDLNNQHSFQSTGQDRVDDFGSRGGFDGGDFGGGDRFGGGGFGGGGFGGGGFGGGDRFGGGGFGGGGFGGFHGGGFRR